MLLLLVLLTLLPACVPACLLQNHSNEDIYEKAVQILETYFDVEDTEVENLAPAVDAAAGTYAFGGAPGGGAPGGPAGAPPAGGFNFALQQ